MKVPQVAQEQLKQIQTQHQHMFRQQELRAREQQRQLLVCLLCIYIVYWNSYAVFNDNRQLRIPLPLTKRQSPMLACLLRSLMKRDELQ